MAEPLDASYEPVLEESDVQSGAGREDAPPAPPVRPRSQRLARRAPSDTAGSLPRIDERSRVAGRTLGTFRNTYYDFPSEGDFEGATVPLKNPRCETIAPVSQAFFQTLCVQGSGTLRKGSTVSFSRRDCECAEICTKTEQRICFDELDARDFPWGRGATGKPITPLLTVAVDPDVIPLGTAIYVPELDGLPRDLDGTSRHDGCFVAQDKGLRVKGNHVDVFTGHSSLTRLWNQLVPSNRGVTVVTESPRCARAASP